MITIDDIKLTVKDYAIDKVRPSRVVMLQRYFLKEYYSWMPLRAIAETTGGRDHTRVLDAVKFVNSNKRLFEISRQLRKILDLKIRRYSPGSERKDGRPYIWVEGSLIRNFQG